jgi:hypothetical protein
MESLEIKVSDPRHDKIVTRIREFFEMSLRTMSKRHEQWNRADELFRGYIKETADDKERKQKSREGKPQYFTIYIPYSYAMLLASHTYATSVFLGRDPVFQYNGRHGESQQQVQALEAVIDYQLGVGEMLTKLFIWLLDQGKYGIGIIGNYWAEETAYITELVTKPKMFLGYAIPGTGKQVRSVLPVRGYEGNKIFNVRPYDWFPDPRVSIINFQRGEFCGRVTREGWNDIIRGRERGDYYNIEELERSGRTGGDSYLRSHGSHTVDLPDWGEVTWSGYMAKRMEDRGKNRGFSEIQEMVVDLIPREWDLGPSGIPEKWVFTLGNDEILIGCKPQGLIHNKYPYAVMSYEIDGYSHTSRGMMEVTQPLNDVMTWMVNSHYFNIRKSLNDMLVVDPSRVVMKDLTEGGAGRIIRLAPQAYGTDTRLPVTQLPVQTVTNTHIQSMQVIADIMQRVTGVTDNIMGMVNQGGRKTATEVRTSSSFGINRLKTNSEWNSALGFAPLSQMLVQNTQQLYDAEKKFRVAGDLLEHGHKFVEVNPESIAGFFDFVPVDGTLPIDRFAQANLWKEILLGLNSVPQIAMQYDVAGIFSWMAQLSGLKNINQFRVQVMPDQAMAAMAQSGEAVPTGQAGYSNGAPAVPGTSGSMMGPPPEG